MLTLSSTLQLIATKIYSPITVDHNNFLDTMLISHGNNVGHIKVP